jgi:hypothetical protein
LYFLHCQVEPVLDGFLQQFQSFPRYPLPVWFTEFNANSVGQVNHTLLDAIYLADIALNTYAARAQIILGNVYTMGEAGFGVFFAGNGPNMPLGEVALYPSFYILKLIMEKFWGTRLGIDTRGRSFPRGASYVRATAALDNAAPARPLSSFIVVHNGTLNILPSGDIQWYAVTAPGYSATDFWCNDDYECSANNDAMGITNGVIKNPTFGDSDGSFSEVNTYDGGSLVGLNYTIPGPGLFVLELSL